MKKRLRRKKKSYKRLFILPILVLLVVLLGIIAFSQLTKTKAPEQQNARSMSQAKSVKEENSSEKSSVATPKWLSAKNENQLPILMFHYVTSDEDQLPKDSNNIDVTTFENELKALKEQGYTTVSAADAQRVLTTKEKPSNKLVWLTFDDGSVTMYTRIFPLLKKYQMHATSFIITSFVDNGQGGILTWEQIKEMKESGWVDFGSHTVDHPDLETQTLEAQRSELADSKADLDKNLTQKTNMICYPAGGYNQNTLDLSTELGYQYGFLDPGRNGAVAMAAKESDGLLTLPRFRMMDTTSAEDMLQMLQPAATYNEQNN